MHASPACERDNHTLSTFQMKYCCIIRGEDTRQDPSSHFLTICTTDYSNGKPFENTSLKGLFGVTARSFCMEAWCKDWRLPHACGGLQALPRSEWHPHCCWPARTHPVQSALAAPAGHSTIFRRQGPFQTAENLPNLEAFQSLTAHAPAVKALRPCGLWPWDATFPGLSWAGEEL